MYVRRATVIFVQKHELGYCLNGIIASCTRCMRVKEGCLCRHLDTKKSRLYAGFLRPFWGGKVFLCPCPKTGFYLSTGLLIKPNEIIMWRIKLEGNYWGIAYDYRRLYAVRDLPTDMLVEIGNMLRGGYDIEWIARQPNNAV